MFTMISNAFKRFFHLHPSTVYDAVKPLTDVQANLALVVQNRGDEAVDKRLEVATLNDEIFAAEAEVIRANNIKGKLDELLNG